MIHFGINMTEKCNSLLIHVIQGCKCISFTNTYQFMNQNLPKNSFLGNLRPATLLKRRP